MSKRASVLASAVLAVACGSGSGEPLSPRELVGSWRAVLTSPGGELPFTLRVSEVAGELSAVIVNGEENAPFSSVEVVGGEVVMAMDWYDSEVVAHRAGEGRLEGRWTKAAPGSGSSQLAFTAVRGDERRFLPIESPASSGATDVSGLWSAEFRDEDGTFPARAELRQEGLEVRGTFLTPTGDYRYLEGSFEAGRLRLSTFDGAHAFLFDALLGPDGRLEGEFFSRDSYRASWVAEPASADTELPDPWTLVSLTNDEQRFRFAFPDVGGKVVSLEDPRFENKVVLVNVFGTWCPNCNDEAPLLAEWQRRYGDEGLEIVGLAYEFSGDFERDARQVERFGERYGIEYPLLLAGTSDKAEAAATLPDLSGVVAYPTSIFIARDGRVRGIYSGFSGPGTGAHHDALLARFELLIEGLLAEPVVG